MTGVGEDKACGGRWQDLAQMGWEEPPLRALWGVWMLEKDGLP